MTEERVEETEDRVDEDDMVQRREDGRVVDVF